MVFKQKGSKYWWFKFFWKGELIRESTRQTNKRVAEQMEAARRTALAKGEVGLIERKPVPTLEEFADQKFLPAVRANRGDGEPQKDKQEGRKRHRTTVFYETTVKNLKRFPKLAKARLDRITSELLGEYTAVRRNAGMKVATVNRELATIRRMFNLAQEWGYVSTRLPRVRLLPGENSRMRVLSVEEEQAYLDAASIMAVRQEKAYQSALDGIRAKVRGEEPIKPDAYLLRDIAIILLDCGLRPDECYRLRWDFIQDGGINIPGGKGKGSRRRVPCTTRVKGVLAMRHAAQEKEFQLNVDSSAPAEVERRNSAEWVFPRRSASGHVTEASIRKLHAAALKTAQLSGIVIYDFRHTRITRWAQVLPLPVVQRLAGHTSISTTMRYVHVSDADVLSAMNRAEAEQERQKASEAGGHSIGHSDLKAAHDDAKTRFPRHSCS